MSSTKLFILACASVMALAVSMPAFAEETDTPAPFSATMSTPDVAPSEAPVVVPADTKAEKKADKKSDEQMQLEDLLAAPADAAPTKNEAPEVEAAPNFLSPGKSDDRSAILGTAPSPEFLDQYYKMNADIALKRLELEAARLQSETDKITGAAAMREAAAASQEAAPAEPEDDTSTLPGVAAIIGAKGVFKAELTTQGGGSLVARPGDMLPGGWKLERIERSAVYVTSPRTGDEYVLSGASSPDSAAVTHSAPAPKTRKEEPAAAPAQDTGSDIIVEPAN